MNVLPVLHYFSIFAIILRSFGFLLLFFNKFVDFALFLCNFAIIRLFLNYFTFLLYFHVVSKIFFCGKVILQILLQFYTISRFCYNLTLFCGFYYSFNLFLRFLSQSLHNFAVFTLFYFLTEEAL